MKVWTYVVIFALGMLVGFAVLAETNGIPSYSDEEWSNRIVEAGLYVAFSNSFEMYSVSNLMIEFEQLDVSDLVIGSIRVSFLTGEVSIPTNMTLTEASIEFWDILSLTYSEAFPCTIETNPPTDLISKWVKEGKICKVIGHQWEYGCSVGLGCLVIHQNPMRHCNLCGIEQMQEIGAWK